MIDYSKLYLRLFTLYPRISSLLPGGLLLPPLHLFVFTTFRCNLRCRMCAYVGLNKEAEGAERELELEEIKGLVDQTAPFGLITFTGGEVLARKDFLEMMEYATGRRRAHIITNGTLLTAEKAEAIVGMGPRSLLGKGLMAVGVSLEGPKDVHDGVTGIEGSYEKTIRGLKYLVEAKRRQGKKFPLIGLQTVISPSTVGYLEDIYGLAEEMGLDVCNFIVENTNIYLQKIGATAGEGLDYCPESPEGMDIGKLEQSLGRIAARSASGRVNVRFSPAGVTPEEIVRYFKGEPTTGKYVCLGPWTRTAVTPYGDVLICPFMKAGNIRQDSLRTIWKNAVSAGFRKKLKAHGLFTGCAQCCWMTYLE